MIGDNLVVRVREILRDVQTITHQGEFWSDAEIRLALNTARDTFINTCLRLKLDYMLSGLLTTTGTVTPITNVNDPNYLGGWIGLPSDYLHYVSGRVADSEDNLYLARLYLGVTAEVYKYSTQAGIFIVNQAYLDALNVPVHITNVYRGIFRNNITCPVELNYYRQPSIIGLTGIDDLDPSFNVQDFDDYIYNDIIVGHAAVLLGMKETQTQREFKVQKQIFKHYNIFPKTLLQLLNNVETIKELIEQVFGKQQQ